MTLWWKELLHAISFDYDVLVKVWEYWCKVHQIFQIILTEKCRNLVGKQWQQNIRKIVWNIHMTKAWDFHDHKKAKRKLCVRTQTCVKIGETFASGANYFNSYNLLYSKCVNCVLYLIILDDIPLNFFFKFKNIIW